MNGNPVSMQDTWQRIAEEGKDNPARQMRLIKSLAQVKGG
jgi:hypothetical protein